MSQQFLAMMLPKFWPRPRPQTFGLGLASISLYYYIIEHFSCKKLLIFPAIILHRMSLIIIICQSVVVAFSQSYFVYTLTTFVV